ncbi:hypothetical protein D6833_09700, partial [Candidatus Parcubacteria bacterium]
NCETPDTVVSDSQVYIQPDNGLYDNSVWSDAVYYIPPEFYRYQDIDPNTGEVLADLMCIRKGPEVFCVPYDAGDGRPNRTVCDSFSITPGGINCVNVDWQITAHVNFPAICLDLRPYPATLVRWPSAARNGCLPTASGSGTYPYVGYGGGSPGNPQAGDWRNLRLTLTLRPADVMRFTMPHIGELLLPPVGPTGSPVLFKWELPSHPAAGGEVLAGSVGLSELPGDMPLFEGEAKAPYRLFWSFTYEEAVDVVECVDGPNGRGEYDCNNDTGHEEVVGLEWVGRSMGGEISPLDVPVPGYMKADIDNNGVPDAFWDRNVIIRRMDYSNSVTGYWAATYHFGGGAVYWGVREGQAQIGWP